MYDAVFLTDHIDYLPTSMLPIGAFKCAHVLRTKGYKCLVVSNITTFSNEELDELFFYSIGPNTKFVGFSTTFIWVENDGLVHQDQGLSENSLIDKIKKRNPTTKIVLGGTKSHLDLKNKNIDYAIIGYGETSVVNLMNHLDNNSSLRNSFKNINGVTIINDKLAPAYDFTKDVMRWLPEDVVNYRVLPIEMARGCIFKCKFCAHMLTGKKKLDYVKEYDVMREELMQVYNDFGITNYMITDDTFNDNVEKLEHIHNITQSLPKQLKLWAYLRLDLINAHPKTLPMLSEIGIRACHFGIETMHPDAAKVVGKGQDREKLLDTLSYMELHNSEISKHGSFIVGLPYEPRESSIDTAEKLLSGKIPLNSFSWQPLRIQKSNTFQNDSEFDREWQKYGYKEVSYLDRTHLFNNISLNWQNEHWIFQDAYDYVSALYQRAQQSDHYFFEGLWSLGMHSYHNLNKDITFDNLRKKLFKEADMQFLNRVKDAFTKEYKHKLFKILDRGF